MFLANLAMAAAELDNQAFKLDMMQMCVRKHKYTFYPLIIIFVTLCTSVTQSERSDAGPTLSD